MKLLEILSKKERGVYRAKGENCFYKIEKGVLYVGTVEFKGWNECEMKVNDLMKIEVEEDFSIVDDNRYEIGNYFENKEETEMCRDLIKKTVRVFEGKNIGKQECEEEFKKIKMIKVNKNPIEKLTIGSNFGSLDDFKKAKECIYLDINGECIGLSLSEWDLLNQHIEKLRKFK